MLLFLLFVILPCVLHCTDYYISSMSDRLFFNFTPTALDATALEMARLACAANTVCAYETVQNNGPYIGVQQWGYLSTHNPPWTPYPYVETPVLVVLNGMTISQINTKLGVSETIEKNVLQPACPIGSTPIRNTVTGEQSCISQNDRALEYNIWVYTTWYIFMIILFLWAILFLWYVSYIPSYLKNLSFRGESPPVKSY